MSGERKFRPLPLRSLSRPSSSSLKITDHSFRYASPCLSNKLSASFRQPNPDHSFSHSSQPNSLSSSVSSFKEKVSFEFRVEKSRLAMDNDSGDDERDELRELG